MKTKLEEFHEETGISQSFIAKKAGLTASAYSLIVRGKSMPSLPSALKIARAVGKTVEYLWGDDI